MQLIDSNVIFNQEQHTYTLNGVLLNGITGMLKRQLFPDKYKDIPEYILNKAAEYGSMIHEALELVDDLGIEHSIQEAQNYIAMKEQYGLLYECSEYIVTDGEFFASPIDKVFRVSDNEFDLADVKTTYQLDEEYVSWQLSIYAYLFELQNPGAKVRKLFAIWLKNEKHALVEVERKPTDKIISLLECERNGEQYSDEVTTDKDIALPADYAALEDSIIEIVTEAKKWNDKLSELKKGIEKEMVTAGVSKWVGENIKTSRSADTIVEEFDVKAFKQDHPELYQQYLVAKTRKGKFTLTVTNNALQPAKPD